MNIEIKEKSATKQLPDVLYMIRARIDSGRKKGAPQLTKDRRVLQKAESEIVKLRAENAALRGSMEWHAIDYAPKERRLLVRTESGEIYAAHFVACPFTGDEAWLVSEAQDGTQHLVKPIEWREI